MIRENVRLAQKFEAMVRSDPRFEIPAARSETHIIILYLFHLELFSVQAPWHGRVPAEGGLLYDGDPPQEAELER